MKHPRLWVYALLLLLWTPGEIARADNLLESLPQFKSYRALRESSYDRSGGNDDYVPIPTSATVTLATIEGPGAIHHIFMTLMASEPRHLRKVVLRMYWDDETHPSVETPLGDFFGLGHGEYYHYQSRPIAIGTENGLNCFWFMPFERRARITVTNKGREPIERLYYYVDYRAYDPADTEFRDRLRRMGRFHAVYRQEKPAPLNKEYVILEAQGRGVYVGCNLSVQTNSYGWWGEGDDKIYIDGASSPTLHGTGTEDYFSGAWCYGEPFDSLYFGCPLRGEMRRGMLWNVYRYHLEDPIPFTRSIRVALEAIHAALPTDVPDNYSSVAYWYQSEPHVPFAPLPPARDRLPYPIPSVFHVANAIEAEPLTILETNTRRGNLAPQSMVRWGEGWSGDRQLFFRDAKPGESFTAELSVPREGLYTLELFFARAADYGRFDVLLNQNRLNKTPLDGYAPRVTSPGPGVVLAPVALAAGKQELTFRVVERNPQSGGDHIGLDCLRLTFSGPLPTPTITR